MAEDKPVQKETPPASPTQNQEPKIPVSTLVARSTEFLGVPPGTAAGGLYGKQGSMTVSDAQKAISAWLNVPTKEKA